MRVLIACEFSGVVRQAFERSGHDAWSVDLLPTEIPSGKHMVEDVRTVLARDGNWDLLIGHPPCTYLCNSGVRHLTEEQGMGPRYLAMKDAIKFYKYLWNFPIEKICIENPRMHYFARMELGRQTQFIQPWQFGHGETKATGLRLKNLPELMPTGIVAGREARVHKASPGANRWKERSRTLRGVAEAMADQWGGLV